MNSRENVIENVMSALCGGALVRQAMAGEVAIVTGWANSGTSGLGLLLLRLADNHPVYLPGDWRCVRTIAEEPVGQEVVVSVGEEYGSWSVSPSDLNEEGLEDEATCQKNAA